MSEQQQHGPVRSLVERIIEEAVDDWISSPDNDEGYEMLTGYRAAADALDAQLAEADAHDARIAELERQLADLQHQHTAQGGLYMTMRESAALANKRAAALDAQLAARTRWPQGDEAAEQLARVLSTIIGDDVVRYDYAAIAALVLQRLA